ncbi:hypothetical protein P153DRAFT_67816 [Dothidotthia symphoricarpi CBS 119687]|uniref:BTB domain-containing protein n=1 Tax=Dothidotthia symphoricarpi CBS 119687 TaxID=1392245 RepID=A0A6A6A9C5_9PLEO|nr:uncharacterized protein P153DRAFT_67816 [Dothidotthia symphoricarpi CBS 119687]KAF2127448.1 hypothetical protein P153DRAFT_67816 [Dothidotthia symphoricarpi CBS 119687]
MLASSWFKRALTKEKWSESGRHESDGRFHVYAEDWDAEAFLIVLNIFHLRNRQVPRTVTLEMLAKVAVLVDYYECGEAIEVFTTMWLHDLKQMPMPTTLCRELILWIWVAWTFELSEQFKLATMVAISQSAVTIQTLGLPIPSKISSEIVRKRYQVIESVIEPLHALLDKYRNSKYVCPRNDDLSFQCGSFLLGALTRELDRLDLFSPRPEIPFYKITFDSLCKLVQNIMSPEWRHSGYSSHGYSSQNILHACSLKTEVTGIVNKATAGLEGLDHDAIGYRT